MKVGFRRDALGAFLRHRGVGTQLSSFLTVESNVISLGVHLLPSKFPPRFGPSGRSQQDSNDYHRDDDDQNDHNRGHANSSVGFSLNPLMRPFDALIEEV
jgi:hypothetical protein